MDGHVMVMVYNTFRFAHVIRVRKCHCIYLELGNLVVELSAELELTFWQKSQLVQQEIRR